MYGRAPLPTILLVLVIAGAAWLLVEVLSDEPDPAAPVAGAGDAASPPASEPAPLESQPRPADQPPPPPAPTPAAPPPAAPTPAAATPERAGPTPPEMFTIESATWKDVPAIEVLEDIARRTGHVLRVSPGSRKILKNMKVTMVVENEKAHMVVGKLLLGHDVDFTVRGNELRIFVDDD